MSCHVLLCRVASCCAVLCKEMMTHHFRMEIIVCEVCVSKIKRYNWLKHLQTTKHKKEAKEEDLTHLAGIVNWKRCWKCQARRSLDMFKEGNETCNRCLDQNRRWAEKNRKREKKKRDGRKDEKKEYNKEYGMRQVVCLTCGCWVRKCKWGRHILSKNMCFCFLNECWGQRFSGWRGRCGKLGGEQ